MARDYDYLFKLLIIGDSGKEKPGISDGKQASPPSWKERRGPVGSCNWGAIGRRGGLCCAATGSSDRGLKRSCVDRTERFGFVVSNARAVLE